MKKPALIIIDVQKDFTQPSGRLPVDLQQADQMIANINAVVTSVADENLTKIYIGNEFRRLDPLNVFRNFAAIEGSVGCELDPRLRVTGKAYFSKREGNALSNASLVTFLSEAKIEHLYLTGLQAEACVYRTFLGARRNGFSCSVVQDAIASKSIARRASMLRNFAARGAEILSTAQLLERSASDSMPVTF